MSPLEHAVAAPCRDDAAAQVGSAEYEPADVAPLARSVGGTYQAVVFEAVLEAGHWWQICTQRRI